MRWTSAADVADLVRALGARRGDTLVVHSALFTFGILEDGTEGFHRALASVVGPDGTIVVPTFTWSFRRGEIFDIKHSPAARSVGTYAEHVRRRSGTIRSADPLFSMAAAGPEAHDLMRRTTINCFGPGSIFERLFDRDVLILGLGITYSTGISPFMHLERLAAVPYRHELLLEGTSRDWDGREHPDRAMHFARDEVNFAGFRTNRDPLGRRMEERRVSECVERGGYRHIGLRARPFAEFVLGALARDPFVMLERAA